MFFYKEEELQITKYFVPAKDIELQRLRQLIIKDCSIISEECIERSEPPRLDDPDKIFEVRKGEYVGVRDEEQGPTRSIYKYYYKERRYSRMVEWIDALLSGNVEILAQIYAGKPEEQESGLRAELASLYEECSAISDKDFDKKIAALNEIKKVARTVEINEGTKPEFYYYDTLLSALHPLPSAAISKEDFNKTLEFLGKTPKDLGMVFINSMPAFGEMAPNSGKQM